MINTIEKVLYTGKTHTRGGRNGESRSSDGRLDIKLSAPGSSAPGTNPEQLFAMGYSACFLGAMKGAARKAGKALPEDTVVTAAVSFADREDGVGYGIVAALSATVPGWSKQDVEATMKAAHDICPYSDLIRNKHDVELTAA